MALEGSSAQVCNKMHVIVNYRETIKPLSPTPDHLRNLKLSLLDQFASTGLNPRILLFYSAEGDVQRFKNANMLYQLKKSLAGILTEFYPLAGRISNNQSIDCNDEGVEYIEARVRAPFMLNQLLTCPNAEELEQLYPPDTTGSGELCAVQVTMFEGCGGMVIGVCTSHAVGDASALSKFINSWAAMARGGKMVSPKFGFADVIPPRDDIFENICSGNEDTALPKILKPVQKLITKRFFFGKSEIASLMTNCASQSPTRMQVVCALLFKCLISVVISKSSKPIVLSMPINWRRRMSPPVPPYCVGNFATSSMSSKITEPKSFHELVGQVGKMIRKFDSGYLKTMLANDATLLLDSIQQEMQLYIKNEVHFLEMSSWCGLPFNEADFGLGRPIWATMFVLNVENFVTLLDTNRGDEIEAWVTLNDEDMAKFESEYMHLLRDFGTSHVRIFAKI